MVEADIARGRPPFLGALQSIGAPVGKRIMLTNCAIVIRKGDFSPLKVVWEKLIEPADTRQVG
jgi:hypothetical protein